MDKERKNLETARKFLYQIECILGFVNNTRRTPYPQTPQDPATKKYPTLILGL